MNTSPAISIIMPVFNGGRFLDRAIESVLHQSFLEWELLVVDDASTDDSAARLAQIAARESRVRLFHHAENRGPGASRNTALREARGHSIAYLDCDDEFYPDHLRRAWESRENGDVLMFRYDVVEDAADGSPAGEMFTHDPGSRAARFKTETIAGSLGVVHRRSLIDGLGGFDEGLWWDEDGDLWRRFARANARFAALPYKSGMAHRHPASLTRAGPPRPPDVEDIEVACGDQRFHMWVTRGEGWVAREIFNNREYGGIPAQFLRKPPIVFDAGANVGMFAVLVLLTIDRNAIVHCFEPCPSTLNVLRRNLASFPAVKIHPFALGKGNGEGQLHISLDNSGSNSLDPRLLRHGAQRVTVPIRDAAEVWDGLGLTEVDILKIDTEGSEVAILESLGSRAQAARVLLIEYHSAVDRRRIDQMFPQHDLFGQVFHSLDLGVLKYVRSDLVRK